MFKSFCVEGKLTKVQLQQCNFKFVDSIQLHANCIEIQSLRSYFCAVELLWHDVSKIITTSPSNEITLNPRYNEVNGMEKFFY